MAAPRTKHAHELLLEQHAIVKATSMGNVMRMEFDDGHSIDVRPRVNINGMPVSPIRYGHLILR